MFEAEAALRSKGDADTPELPRRLLDAMVNRHAERKPWRGPLLKPRCSPLVRLGDIQVLDKRSPVAKVHNGAISRSWSAVSGAGLDDLPEPRSCVAKKKTKSADVDREDWLV